MKSLTIKTPLMPLFVISIVQFLIFLGGTFCFNLNSVFQVFLVLIFIVLSVTVCFSHYKDALLNGNKKMVFFKLMFTMLKIVIIIGVLLLSIYVLNIKLTKADIAMTVLYYIAGLILELKYVLKLLGTKAKPV
ncbi:MAG: hypothetical protein QM539_00705 [Alphaproteobacteria bacterium]|nr:hypothetical protein [Alphaproteobacteria bacterium]